jgi:hypothetical protein
VKVIGMSVCALTSSERLTLSTLMESISTVFAVMLRSSRLASMYFRTAVSASFNSMSPKRQPLRRRQNGRIDGEDKLVVNLEHSRHVDRQRGPHEKGCSHHDEHGGEVPALVAGEILETVQYGAHGQSPARLGFRCPPGGLHASWRAK